MHELSAAAGGRAWLRTRLLLGYYSPLGARAATRAAAWLYCLFIAPILSSILIQAFSNEGMETLSGSIIAIEYCANAVISLVTGDKHVFNYLKEIELIDREMGYDLSLTTPAIRLLYLIIFIEKLAIWVGGVFVISNSLNTAFFMMWILLTAINLNYLTIILPLDLLRVRLRRLSRSLEINLNQHHSNLNNVDDQIKMLQDGLKLYKRLIDNFSHTFNWSKLRIVIGLTCCTTAFFLTGYAILRDLMNNRYNWTFGEMMRAIEFSFNPTVCFLPVVFSELATRECERLKTSVGNLTLLCEDSSLCHELEMAGEYLELRPFRVSILRMLVLDGSFLLSYVGLLLTYFIILIQVTGLV